MATEVKMPRLSLTMESGVLLKWLKSEGDFVSKGEGLAEIETDKATAVLEAPASGYVRMLLANEGADTPCDAVVGILTATRDEAYERGGEPDADRPPAEPAAEVARQTRPAGPGAREIQASPAAKHLARQLGIDLATVTGTGPKGRIGMEDVQRAATEREQAEPAAQSASPVFTTSRTPLTKMRAAIARRMVESATTIPQFSVRRRVDMAGALRFLATANRSAAGRTPGVADLLHFAVARALRAHPEMNASFEPGTETDFGYIVQHEEVNLGVAVALADGLVVPVIRRADTLSLEALAEERVRLQDEAQGGRLPAGSLGGATFTVSNLGPLGADDFMAIVNPPEAAILAVGRVQDTVVVRDGGIHVVPTVTLSVTADHRILDGAQVARFFGTLAEYLADPAALVQGRHG